MINKNIFEELITIYAKHSDIFLGEELKLSDFGKVYNQTCEKYCYCLSKKDSKHYPTKLIKHSDEYPTLEEGVVFFPNSTVIGSIHIGNNSAIGAGVQLFNKNVSENSAVSLRHPKGTTINKIKWSIKPRFFPK